jgi:hypothetical protein
LSTPVRTLIHSRASAPCGLEAHWSKLITERKSEICFRCYQQHLDQKQFTHQVTGYRNEPHNCDGSSGKGVWLHVR